MVSVTCKALNLSELQFLRVSSGNNNAGLKALLEGWMGWCGSGRQSVLGVLLILSTLSTAGLRTLAPPPRWVAHKPHTQKSWDLDFWGGSSCWNRERHNAGNAMWSVVAKPHMNYITSLHPCPSHCHSHLFDNGIGDIRPNYLLSTFWMPNKVQGKKNREKGIKTYSSGLEPNKRSSCC